MKTSTVMSTQLSLKDKFIVKNCIFVASDHRWNTQNNTNKLYFTAKYDILVIDCSLQNSLKLEMSLQ